MSDLDHETRSHVAQRLAMAGLDGPAIDLDEVVADYLDRIETDRSLDELIGPGEPGRNGEER